MRASTAVCLTGVTALIVSFVSFAPAVKAARGQSSPSGQTSSQQPAPPGGERKPGPAITFQVPPMPELPNNGLGESDQPQIPGQPWRVRDVNRPRPADVTPGKHFGDAPSDALVLFDGTDLSRWTMSAGRGASPATTPAAGTPTWKVENGYMEVTPGMGSLVSKERFRDFQLHLEFAEPPVPLGASQYRGNSGVIIGGRELQILDNYKNPTYADGYVAAVYGMWPPLSNPSRPPGEWQTLDIAYMAPRYEGDKLVRNAVITVFLNGVMVHDNREIQPSAGRGGAARGVPPGGGAGPPQAAQAARTPASAPAADQPISLMGHPSAIPGNAVRYRNIWVRRVEIEMPTETSPGRGQ